MKKSFKLFELLNLEAEIVGVVNTQTGETVRPGLLSQKLPLTAKFWLGEFVEFLQKDKKSLESLREELIKKYGVEDENGNIGISTFLPKKDENDEKEELQFNPNYIQFSDEYGELLNESKSLDAPLFKPEDFSNVITEIDFPLVRKYLIEKPAEEIEVEEV
jgi:hypothetical protein